MIETERVQSPVSEASSWRWYNNEILVSSLHQSILQYKGRVQDDLKDVLERRMVFMKSICTYLYERLGNPECYPRTFEDVFTSKIASSADFLHATLPLSRSTASTVVI